MCVPICCPLSHTVACWLTDSKRTIQVAVASLEGSWKSRLYHATVPMKLRGPYWPAFQAFGTLIAVHPAVEVERSKPRAFPTPRS